MESTRSIYRKMTLIMVAILFSIICTIYIFFICNIGKVYEENAVESILDVKKEFLKDTIDNLILEIEIIQTREKQHYAQWVINTSQMLQDYYEVSPDNYIDLFINLNETGGNKEAISVFIKDLKLNKTIYLNGVFLEDNSNIEDLASYEINHYDDYEIVFGVSNEYVDNKTKQLIGDRIRGRKFSEDSYIWVNEIKNYKGGKDYAVRVVYPNYPNEEGRYLSSDVPDVVGNYPYEEELKGINENGEIFFNYRFKKRNSGNDISEKISYAKLYEKYDWVIATGVQLDDIQAYIKTSTEETQEIVKEIIRNTVLFMLIIFVFYLLVLSKVETWYYRTYDKRLKEVYIDPLTKTQNRRAATNHIEKAFRHFKKTGESPMIMIIDLDDFKKINDTYGHLEGDRVLKNVVSLINRNIRGTDTLYRWGGEEFLLICNGLKEDGVIPFSNKIITVVGREEYELDGKVYNTTISVGVDRFVSTDKTYEEAIERADIAMYNAKEQGKNRACLGDMCGINPFIKY